MQNKFLKILLALIAVAAAGTALYFQLSTEVPVLKNDIKAGQVLEAKDIDEVRFMKMSLPEGTYEKGIDMVGKETAYNVPAGVPVPTAALKKVIKAEDIIPSDEAIVPVQISFERAPSDLKENDRINILAYFQAGVVQDAPAFLIGIDEQATVKTVKKDETGHIIGVDISVKKNLAPEIAASVSMGNIYIIKNVTDNDISLPGTTGKDIYDSNFSNGEVEIIITEGEVNR